MGRDFWWLMGIIMMVMIAGTAFIFLILITRGSLGQGLRMSVPWEDWRQSENVDDRRRKKDKGE